MIKFTASKPFFFLNLNLVEIGVGDVDNKFRNELCEYLMTIGFSNH